MKTDIKERLRDLAEAAPRGIEVPPTLAPRAHRRVAMTVVLAACVVSIAAAGVFAGIRSLRSRPSEPVNRPTPTGVTPISAVQAWFRDARGRIVISSRDGLIEAVDPIDPTKTYDLPTEYTGIPLSWSTDGSRLLIAGKSLYVLSSDGTKTDLNTGQMSWGSIKPDGSAVVYPGLHGLYVVSSDGAVPHLLLRAPKGTYMFMPVWSPDGGQIVYLAGGSAPNSWTISVINADGSGGKVLVDLHGQYLTEAGWFAWSPDGTKLAFALNRCKLCAKIYVMNADGSGMRRIAHIPDGVSPVWSPDGTRLAFIAGGYVKSVNAISPDSSSPVDLNIPARPPFITWNPVR